MDHHCVPLVFGFMIAWHFIGQQNLNKEAYRIAPSNYERKVEEFAKKYTVREEQGVPVVKAAAGTDLYLLGRLWQWWPILKLEKGVSYRIHISSVDWQHGFSLQPTNINIQRLRVPMIVAESREATDGALAMEG
jgi:cytochrome c oxidase subunit 2